MEYHPHVHMLVSAGGISGDGTEWQDAKPGFLVPVKALSRLFRNRMRRELETLRPDLSAALPASLWKKEWVANILPWGSGGRGVLDYLGRYVFRVAVTSARILGMDGEIGRTLSARAVGGGGRFFIPASSCEISLELAGISDASGPVHFRVRLLRIVDGDTIRILWQGENTAVRLLGIIAPERNQPGYREATDCLRILMGDADTVDLAFPSQQPKRDSLGRLLATL